MGKLITKGYASREVEYDRVEITFDFRAREQETKDALRRVREDSESFLGMLEEAGYDLSSIVAGENSVSKNQWRGEEPYVQVSKSFTIYSEYDLNFIEWVTQIIEQGSYSVDVDFDPYISFEKELHDELLKDAAQNAREKAELIANATGTTIKGIERIKVEKDEDMAFLDEKYDYIRMGRECARGLEDPGAKYTMLKVPSTTKSREIFIEWEMDN